MMMQMPPDQPSVGLMAKIFEVTKLASKWPRREITGVVGVVVEDEVGAVAVVLAADRVVEDVEVAEMEVNK